jgi:hypothetical protein
MAYIFGMEVQPQIINTPIDFKAKGKVTVSLNIKRHILSIN